MAHDNYLPRVAAVRVVRDRVIHVTFDDGLRGEVDVAQFLWGQVFDELAQSDEAFGDIRSDGSTVVWGNGADLAPETLYNLVIENAGRHPLSR